MNWWQPTIQTDEKQIHWYITGLVLNYGISNTNVLEI